jgi:septum formation protein
MQIILASGSITRKLLLERLIGSFKIIPPDINETQKIGEQPRDLAARLSNEKAQKIACDNEVEESIVIGSDQVAYCDGRILEKKSHFDEIEEQIMWQIGKKTEFFTSLTVINSQNFICKSAVIESTVIYRDKSIITSESVKEYIRKENPLNCAGGTKFESGGICFIKEVSTQDPTALMGLPLIQLCEFFNEFGLDPLNL